MERSPRIALVEELLLSWEPLRLSIPVEISLTTLSEWQDFSMHGMRRRTSNLPD